MPKQKPVTGAAQPVEKSYVFISKEQEKQEEAGRKLRGMTSAALPRWETVPPRPNVPTRGPQSAMAAIPDADFVETYATAEELSEFRARIEARRAKAGAADWRRLPGGLVIRGTDVLYICSNCKRAVWLKPAVTEQVCSVCNFSRKASGGKLRPASSIEIQEWYKREAAYQKRLQAARMAGRKAVREFNERRLAELPSLRGKL